MTPLFRTRTLNTNNPSAGKIDAPPPPLFASSSSSSSAVVPSPSPLPSKLPQSLHIDKRRRDPLAPASRSASHPFAITSSPLKRSDEAMNLDEDNVVDSPSPKRRSVEGPVSSQSSFTSSKNNLDFSVFDAENRNPDLEMTVSAGLLSTSAPTSRPSFRDIEPPFIFAVPQSPASSSIPKRSSSLRKSTLQQRQPEQPFSLFSPQLDTSAEDVDSDDSGVRTHTRERSRTCNDAPGDNDFSPSSPFFNANSTASPATMNPQHQRLQQLQTQQNTSSHPLSRTLTQSSSEESLLDDSPSHEPVRNSLEKARPILHFSKSLPAGSTRPNYDPSELQTRDTLQPPTAAAVVAAADASFATPINYRLVKPLPAAFMSTGLISKKNKNAEDVALSGTKNMPDTPCKRSIFPLLGASTSAAGPTSGNMIVAGSGNLANNAGNASVPRSATVAGGKHKTMNRSALGTNVLCASQSGTSESAGGHGTDNDEMNNTTTTTMTDSLEEMNDRSNNIIYSNNGNLTANISTTAGTTFKTTPHPGPFSKGLGIFGSSFVKSRMMRRSSSSGSIDGDPSQASPSAKYGFNHGKNTSLDAEFPPTPTKAFTPANDDHSATGTIGGGSSIFQTAHTSRFAKP
ncbi:ATP synthase d subunit, partial [Ascosphaera pollenicola]